MLFVFEIEVALCEILVTNGVEVSKSSNASVKGSEEVTFLILRLEMTLEPANVSDASTCVQDQVKHQTICQFVHFKLIFVSAHNSSYIQNVFEILLAYQCIPLLNLILFI